MCQHQKHCLNLLYGFEVGSEGGSTALGQQGQQNQFWGHAGVPGQEMQLFPLQQGVHLVEEGDVGIPPFHVPTQQPLPVVVQLLAGVDEGLQEGLLFLPLNDAHAQLRALFSNPLGIFSHILSWSTACTDDPVDDLFHQLHQGSTWHSVWILERPVESGDDLQGEGEEVEVNPQVVGRTTRKVELTAGQLELTPPV